MREGINRQVIRNLSTKPAKFLVHRVFQTKRQNVPTQFPLNSLSPSAHDPSPSLSLQANRKACRLLLCTLDDCLAVHYRLGRSGFAGPVSGFLISVGRYCFSCAEFGIYALAVSRLGRYY